MDSTDVIVLALTAGALCELAGIGLAAWELQVRTSDHRRFQTARTQRPVVTADISAGVSVDAVVIQDPTRPVDVGMLDALRDHSSREHKRLAEAGVKGAARAEDAAVQRATEAMAPVLEYVSASGARPWRAVLSLGLLVAGLILQTTSAIVAVLVPS
jgi:hypothetical protein